MKRKRYLRSAAGSVDCQEEFLDSAFGALPTPKDRYVDEMRSGYLGNPGLRRLLQDCARDPQPTHRPGQIEVQDLSRFGRTLDPGTLRVMSSALEALGWRIREAVSPASETLSITRLEEASVRHQAVATLYRLTRG